MGFIEGRGKKKRTKREEGRTKNKEGREVNASEGKGWGAGDEVAGSFGADGLASQNRKSKIENRSDSCIVS
jgi:hypothetical protein